MKSKGGASLYEVLKSASRPGSNPAPAAAPAPEAPASSSDGQPTLQERLAAYKALKLAAAQAPTATAVADPTPVPVAWADPTPPPVPYLPTRLLTPLVPPPKPDSKVATGPGERVFKLTYNTAAFAALVVIGLVFVAYAIGVKSGRARVAEAAPEPAAAKPAPLPPIDFRPPAPPPPKVYTIHLAEWPTRNAQERLKATDLSDTYKRALDRAGFRNVETVKIVRGGEERLAMYLDRFKDIGADTAKSRLSAVQKLKVQTQAPFTQAAFEEVPR